MRNFAIIAHVDHGKTTLLDTLMNQGGQQASERLMDNNDLEKERGITISSKYTSFPWRDCVFNAVDTPGHADFGGEVERVLDMVDGCLLLVDAQEGPMAQTKFVLSKALQKGLRPVVCLNKVDRPGVTESGCAEVESKLFDLFANMGATDDQLDFAVVYASAREGVASLDFAEATRLCAAPESQRSVAPLLDVLLARVPPPPGSARAAFKMLVSMIEHDAFVGRLVTGRVASGSVEVGDRVKAMRRGAVLVDIAIDQGGCFETSHATTHDDPTFIVDEVVHYCVANMPAAVARSSTAALNNATLPYVLALADQGYREALQADAHFRAGLNVLAGDVTHGAVAEALLPTSALTALSLASNELCDVDIFGKVDQIARAHTASCAHTACTPWHTARTSHVHARTCAETLDPQKFSKSAEKLCK